jgi:hypothetical protein
VQLMFSIFQLGLFYNEALLDTVTKYIWKRRSGIYRAEKRRAIKMAAIWRNIEGHNIEDKVHGTVSQLDETWLKYSLALYDYVKVQQLDDICETRH